MEPQFIDSEQERTFNLEKKKEIDDVKRIINDTLIEFHNYEFPKYIGNYKKYLGFVADRLAGLDDWQSNVDYPLVASVVDTMFGNIFDFGYEVGINEPKLKEMCNDAFDFRGSGKKVFKEATKEILICWKAYVKDYLLKESTEEEFFGQKIKQTIKTPSMYYISIFDVLYDRTKGLTNSPYKIIRTYATGEAIKQKIFPMIAVDIAKEEDVKAAEKKFDSLLKTYKDEIGTRFSMFDYNPVKSLTSTTQLMNADAMMSYALPFVKSMTDIRAGISLESGSTVSDEQKNNYFLNNKTSTYELVEYNTSDQKMAFINGNLIYMGQKKYNLGEIREANFSSIPGTGNANGVADNLGGLQDINNMLWNSFLDNIKLVMGPMFKITGNVPIAKGGTLDFKKFRAFRTTGNSDIEKIQLGVTDFAPINFMQVVQSFSEQRSGVNNYITGGAGSVERVAWGIDIKFNQYKSKLTPITDSIDQMMGNIMRSWIMMFFKFYTKEELKVMGIDVLEVFEEDKNGKSKFSTFTVNGIDIKDIINERNITFTYNSLDKLTKENSRASIKETLPFLLQYAGQQLNMQEIVKVLVGQDFDPQKIIVEGKPKFEPGTYPEGTKSAGYAEGWYQPSTPPAQDGEQQSYDNYSNNYDKDKYDSSYKGSNSFTPGSEDMESQNLTDEEVISQLAEIS